VLYDYASWWPNQELDNTKILRVKAGNQFKGHNKFQVSRPSGVNDERLTDRYGIQNIE
jgi:hypothetical protein